MEPKRPALEPIGDDYKKFFNFDNLIKEYEIEYEK